MQKTSYSILYVIHSLIITLMFTSCVHKQTDPFNASDAPLHNTVLRDITTLMTPQPDSALNLIVALSDTLDESKMTPSDYYEYQILVSEALYKNNCSFTNDNALYNAVEYYDSMVLVYPKNIDLQYQQARAYYYKGASEEKKENTVESCTCYLKALEIMETITEKMPERKDFRHFTALTYNRLGNAYLYNEAYNISIECLKNAISYFDSENKLYDITVNNKLIGELFYQMEEYDSAMFYLNKADCLCNLDKYNPVLKRDIDKSMAMVLFASGWDKSEAYRILYQAISQTKESDEQILEFILGSFYYEDKQYDSALYYLEKGFLHNKYTKIDASNRIVSICNITGDTEKALYYSNYLADETRNDIEELSYKSKTVSLYEQYKQKKFEVREQYRRRHNAVTVILLSIKDIIVCTGLVILLKRRKKIYKEKLSSKDNEIESLKENISSKDFSIKTMSGKLKRMSSDLKNKDSEIKNKDIEIKSLKKKNNNDNKLQTMDDTLFEEKMQTLLASSACTELFSKISNTSVKSCSNYPELKLSKVEHNNIIKAVDKVFDNFSRYLLQTYPQLNKSYIIYCCLFLIDFEEKHISAFMGIDYSAVWKRKRKLQEIFGSSAEISQIMMDFIKKTNFNKS